MPNFIFRTHRLPTLLVSALILLGTAYGQGAPLRALTTTGMIADVLANVGGTCLEVDAMMGPGIDPHLYQASASDVRSLQRADMIFFSGYSLEGQLGDVLDRFGEQKPVVAVAPSAIAPSQLISVDTVYGIDPHLWMDVGLWALTVDVLAEAVAAERTDCTEELQANAAGFRAELDALDGWIAAGIATIPEAQRILVTAHDAFAYYGRAYGIEVFGIQGISTESEAGIGDIRATVDLVVERRVPALFIESTINPRTVEAVIEAARDRGHDVIIGAELFSDAMGEPGTASGTYLGMLFENTRHIVEALGGTLPPLPDALGPWAERWGVELP
jgi:manganese/zinc/iron transport system substrate-binding protein